MQSPDLQFTEMDRLSQAGIPFFFIIDFQIENIEIYQISDIENLGLSIDFPAFKTLNASGAIPGEIQFSAFPESEEEYRKGFRNIQKNQREGNCYLANYTCKTRIETNLTLETAFLAASAKYKVFSPGRFVFFSPETFVEIKDNRISTHPMKGTIDASLENAKEILKSNPKEKAEHYTVVDLLRNDLSMVADEVVVDDFQRIDFIRTRQKNLYAMSSEISGALKPEFRGKMGSIMKKLLPAGSILGAPKPKTFEIILKSENYDRGFYTGVCGWFDGENLDSAVMIRFVEQQNGNLYFKSGGGITHLSTFADEYQEMKNKIYVPIF